MKNCVYFFYSFNHLESKCSEITFLERKPASFKSVQNFCMHFFRIHHCHAQKPCTLYQNACYESEKHRIVVFLWPTKVSEAVYKRDWHNVNIYFLTCNNFRWKFRTHSVQIPVLACTYLNNAWDLVLWALPLSVCLFKINCFMYSPVVSRFGQKRL